MKGPQVIAGRSFDLLHMLQLFELGPGHGDLGRMVLEFLDQSGQPLDLLLLLGVILQLLFPVQTLALYEGRIIAGIPGGGAVFDLIDHICDLV